VRSTPARTPDSSADRITAPAWRPLAGRLAVVLVAVLAALLPATAVPTFAVPAAADVAADGDCVGLVVDHGDGTTATGCVPFSPGLTGQQVLQQAGRALAFDKSGFICQIDSFPATCTANATHYWSYYHRAPGADVAKWAYSQKGAAQYVVHPGETEGWVWVNGQRTPPTPKAVPYPRLAASVPTPAAAPTTSASATGTSTTGTSTTDGGGVPWPVVVGVVIVVLLGAGAFWQLRRRA